MSTKIEWTDETINPVVGCTKISAGCQNCYALRMARRLRGQHLRGYADVIANGGQWSGITGFVPSELEKPARWRKPRMVFVCSMGDLFHDTVTRGIHEQVFAMIDQNPRHTFLLLTKRPRRMVEAFGGRRPHDNCWCGVTAENQAAYDERVPILNELRGSRCFVSCEPMLGAIDISDAYVAYPDWIICGAETGPGARPMRQEWAEELYGQARSFGIPFFGKKDSSGQPLKVGGQVVREFMEAKRSNQGYGAESGGNTPGAEVQAAAVQRPSWLLAISISRWRTVARNGAQNGSARNWRRRWSGW